MRIRHKKDNNYQAEVLEESPHYYITKQGGAYSKEGWEPVPEPEWMRRTTGITVGTYTETHGGHIAGWGYLLVNGASVMSPSHWNKRFKVEIVGDGNIEIYERNGWWR